MVFIKKLNLPKMDLSKFDFSRLSSISQKLNETIQPISSKMGLGDLMNNFENTDDGLVPVTEISADQFLEKLYTSGKTYHLGEINNITRVVGVVKVDSTKFIKEYGIIDNYEFEDSVIFHGKSKEQSLQIGKCIIFLNCNFKKFLTFKYCFSEDLPPEEFRQETEAIQLIGGIYNSINFEDNNLPFGISFENFEGRSLRLKTLEVKNNFFSKAGISIKNSEIFDLCDLSGNHIENIGIDFQNCHLKCPVRFSSNITPTLAFTGKESIYEKDIRIWNDSHDSIVWNDGTFKSEIDISAVKIAKHFSLIGSTFEDKFKFNRKDNNAQVRNLSLPEEIYIQDCSFNNGFEFNGDKFKGNKLKINFSEKSSGVIDIQDTFFKEVELKGNNFNNSVFLRDCSYDKLTFEKFFNRSLISLNNNNPISNDGLPKELKIENSNLGNTEFYDFDFSVYPVVRVIDSRIDNIYTFGVEWFDKNQLHVDEEETSTLKILSQKREIYRQLKLAAEKQSDKITSLFFKSREIQLHRDVLENKKEQSFSGKKIQLLSWFQKQSDLISINLGKTNYHGQNWILPLIWIIAITLAFYPFLMILSDPKISIAWDWTPQGWNLFWDKFGEHGKAIPQLFNPARRLSDLFENTNSIWLHFLDGLHRIILAFFIFQIVSAFRKFVK